MKYIEGGSLELIELSSVLTLDLKTLNFEVNIRFVSLFLKVLWNIIF